MTKQCARWLAVLAVALLAACNGGSSPDRASSTSVSATAGAGGSRGSASSSSSPEPTGPSVAPAGPPGKPITVAFAGDIHGEPPISDVLNSGGNPLAAMAPILQRADVTVANLETTIGNTGAKVPKKFNFQSNVSLLRAVKTAGVDIVSVANNHSYDFGAAGFQSTILNLLATGLTPVGGGADAAHAYAPAIVDVRGTKVAIVGIAVIGPPDAGRATATRAGTTNGRDVNATLAAIRAARAQAPIVVAFMHWGVELASCPTAEDRSLAQKLLDAGATAVIGSHPHVLQGQSSPTPGKLIAYSMGNFVFYAKRDAARRTGVLTVSFSPDGTVTGQAFDPGLIDSQGRPIPLTGAAADQARAAYSRLNIGGPSCP